MHDIFSQIYIPLLQYVILRVWTSPTAHRRVCPIGADVVNMPSPLLLKKINFKLIITYHNMPKDIFPLLAYIIIIFPKRSPKKNESCLHHNFFPREHSGEKANFFKGLPYIKISLNCHLSPPYLYWYFQIGMTPNSSTTQSSQVKRNMLVGKIHWWRNQQTPYTAVILQICVWFLFK